MLFRSPQPPVLETGALPIELPTHNTDREGFELSVPFGTTVFKTVAIDHSATCPYASGETRTRNPGWEAVFETAAYTIPPPKQMMPVNVDGFSQTTGTKARMGSEGLEPPTLSV